MDIFRFVKWESGGSFSPVSRGAVLEFFGGWLQISSHAPTYRAFAIEGNWRGWPWVLCRRGFTVIKCMGASKILRYTLSLRLWSHCVTVGRPYPNRYRGVRVVS